MIEFLNLKKINSQYEGEISKRINDDNTITYVGRIINEKYADGYVIKAEIDPHELVDIIRSLGFDVPEVTTPE